MRVPYGDDHAFFKYSLFLVLCNRITTSAISAGALISSKKALNPVAPIYKYGLVSVSNILTTTCQYEVIKLSGSFYFFPKSVSVLVLLTRRAPQLLVPGPQICQLSCSNTCKMCQNDTCYGKGNESFHILWA